METDLERAIERTALVAFSGGQDSTTCLAWALSRFERVITVGFDYGQRHAVELDARRIVLKRISEQFPHWAVRLGPDHVIQLNLLDELGRERFGDSEAAVIGGSEAFVTGRRYIPGRNLIFLSMVAIVAFRMNARDIVCGVSETEYSGYPDCTAKAMDATQDAINASMAMNVELHTPLMLLDKAGVWGLAESLGGLSLVDVIINDTHTCYAGDRSAVFPWGKGCGNCNACQLRAKGYSEYRSERRQP